MSQQNAVQEREQQGLQQYKSFHQLLTGDAVQPQIANALPNHLTAERFIRVALTAMSRNADLLVCDQRSVIGSLVQAAELGLEVNTPLGHAYLIPYWNSKTKRKEAQLQIGYRGFIALARRSGDISTIAAEVVYENDHFDIELGTNRGIKHKPNLNPANRGTKIGVYATVQFKDGTIDFEYMTAEQVAAVQSRSKSGESGPWKTDEEEMWRKTPIRRLSKRLPLAIEDADLLTKAAAIDEYNDKGFGGSFLPPAEIPDAPAPVQVISEEQRTGLVHLATELGVIEKLGEIVKSEGFDMLASITADRYDNVEATIREAAAPKGDEPAPEPAPEPQAPAAEPPPEPIDKEPEPEPIDRAESQLADLLNSAEDLLIEVTNGEEADAAKILNGRTVKSMDLKQVRAFIKELEKLKK